MEQDDSPKTGLSRRQILGRMAAGGAVVWSVPVVESFTSKAWGATGSPAPGVGDVCTCQSAVTGVTETGVQNVTNPQNRLLHKLASILATASASCGDGVTCATPVVSFSFTSVAATKATLDSSANDGTAVVKINSPSGNSGEPSITLGIAVDVTCGTDTCSTRELWKLDFVYATGAMTATSLGPWTP